MLTQERLKELLHYDESTGVFTWRFSRGTAKAGNVAGTLTHDGYIRISIDRRRHRAHRLAWLYVHGEFPPDQLDHRDHAVADNRITNLRAATQSENNKNQRIRANNKSGYKGVSWINREGKWCAAAKLDGKTNHIGYFSTAEAASEAYQAFARQNHGAFYLPPEGLSV